jgi:preprotein translocase subunit SecG
MTTLLIAALSVLVVFVCVVSILMSTSAGARWSEKWWRRLNRRA